MSQTLIQLLNDPGFREGTDWLRRDWSANQDVFREGDEGKQLYILLEGAVRITGDVVLDQERRIHPGFCDLEKGAVFGEMVLFDDAPRSATVKTITSCQMAVIDGARLLEFFAGRPDVGYRVLYELMQITVQRLRQTNKKLFTLLAWGLKAHQIDTDL